MIVSMVYSCLLFVIFDSGLDKRCLFLRILFDYFRLLQLCLLLLLLVLTLLIVAVLQIPFYKDVLLLELFVLLLVCPYVYQHLTSNTEHSVEFTNSLDP